MKYNSFSLRESRDSCLDIRASLHVMVQSISLIATHSAARVKHDVPYRESCSTPKHTKVGKHVDEKLQKKYFPVCVFSQNSSTFARYDVRT